MKQVWATLLVEDKLPDAELLGNVLRAEVFAVRRVASLAEARQALTGERFDLILLDLCLPDSCGIDTFLQVRKVSGQTPIVVVTAAEDEPEARKAVHLGAQDYLVKDRIDSWQMVRTAMYAIEWADAARAIEAQGRLEKRVQRRTKALQQSQERLAQVLASSPVVVWTMDLSGVVTFIDGRLGPLGLSAKQVIGKRLPDVLGRHRRLIADLQQALEGKEVIGEINYHSQVLEMRYSPLRDAEGRIAGVMGVAIDISAKRHALREVIMATQREQRRIGQDLHDTVLGSLAGVGLALSRVRELLGGAEELREAMAQADMAATVVKQVIQQIRGLVKGACPTTLKGQGLPAALEHLAGTVSSLFGIECSFRCVQPVQLEDEMLASQFYYVGQEAVNNAVKHARGKKIGISLEHTEDGLKLTVEDDGVGIPHDSCSVSTGLGLRTMHYRAHMIGAALEVRRGRQGGTVVSLKSQV